MSISRRSFLFGTFSATVLTTLWQIDPSKAKVEIGSSPEDKKLIIKMIRDIYPHDRFPDAPYERTADDVITKGNASSEIAMILQEGINDLKKKSYGNMSEKKAVKHLKKIENSKFFNHVRSTSVVTLYNDQEVWSLLGYEGSSFEKGGYIKRGFNDLDWLPDPRIEEHPELASFLAQSPKKLASLRETIKNY